MTAIPLFTSINYARPSTRAEGALSTLSNYFYLGGARATVIEKNKVQLENGKVSWKIIALKIVSYVILFPITLTLLTIDLVLRTQYHFIVINPSENSNQATFSGMQEREFSPNPILPEPVQTKPIQPEPIQTKEPIQTESTQPEPIQTKEHRQTEELIEQIRQEIIPIVPKKEVFSPFTIKIFGENPSPISSTEELCLKAEEIGRLVSNEHTQLCIEVPLYGVERTQLLKFIEELKNVCDVVSQGHNRYYIVPQKEKKEEMQKNLIIRTYKNGVIEEVKSFKAGADNWQNWEGRRTYPNGVIETGTFRDFSLYSGTRTEKETTTFRSPTKLAIYSELDRDLMYADLRGKSELIAIEKIANSRSDYVPAEAELIPTLATVLTKTEVVNYEMLQKIFSDSINFEEFVKYLFDSNSIFYLSSSSLKIILKLIQEKGSSIDLRKQHPETKKTVLNYHEGDEEITHTLLAIDPTLIKEAEKILSMQFKNKIERSFYGSEKTEEMAKELFANIPKHLELEQVVDFIFSNRFCITVLLDSLRIAHPSLTLSPYDTIRKAIAEDNDHKRLTNSSLMEMFKQYNLEADEEKLKSCFELAFRLNHPYLYPISKTSVPTSDYSLNFLWVNLDPQDRIQDLAEHIFKDGLDPAENADCIKDQKVLRALEETEDSLEDEELENWKKCKKSFTYKISKWADIHPNAQMNLWYDSALVTQKAQLNTFEMLKSISESRRVNLQLRDIRQLSNIDGEVGYSLHPASPVYYRVDLLKVLIADHMMSASEESAKYCVISDIDVEPMTAEHLFDQRTLDYLSTNGYLFNKVGIGNFENNFFIFNKEKEDLRHIHKTSIIEEMNSTLTELRKYPINSSFRREAILDAQGVFTLYRRFFLQNMKEPYSNAPRKIVKSPTSQFNFGGNFPKSDYRAESFRFIGSSNIPYTRNGRGGSNHKEKQIKTLRNWKAEPLPRDS